MTIKFRLHQPTRRSSTADRQCIVGSMLPELKKLPFELLKAATH